MSDFRRLGPFHGTLNSPMTRYDLADGAHRVSGAHSNDGLIPVKVGTAERVEV